MGREAQPFVAFGFASVHDALEAEDVLRGDGIPATPIPPPKELGATCGLALRVCPDDAALADESMSAAGKPPISRADFLDL